MFVIIRFTIIFLGIFLVGKYALADDYAGAVQAAKAQNFAQAKAILKTLAQKGDVRAQAELGGLLISGANSDQDTREGVMWIKSAADKGNAISQYNLGNLYLEGKAVPLDYKQAMSWLLKAADQNVPEAQLNIASMFADGEGVAQDYKEAAKWLKIAAANGNNDAQIALGRAYVQGVGVDKDPVRGFMWGQIASEGSAMSDLERNSVRELAEKSLSKEDIARANDLIKKCKDSKLKEC